MNKNISGGGAQTNRNGLAFEQTTSLKNALINKGYSVENSIVKLNGFELGYCLSKWDYKRFLESQKVDLSVNSDTLLPDDAFVNIANKTIYIIEKKFQNGGGSVDEKLQTCLYKKQQYEKLNSQIGYNTEYAYVLNDYFDKSKYNDVKKFILDNSCHYFSNEIPIEFLGL